MKRSNKKSSFRHAGVKRGFTLIELLVVIAIIAILAAILLSVPTHKVNMNMSFMRMNAALKPLSHEMQRL